MDFSFTEEQEAVRDLAAQIFAGPGHRRAGQGGRGRATSASTASSGPSWPTAGLLGIAAARGRTAAAGSGSSSCASLLEAAGPHASRRCRCWPTLVARRAAGRRVRHRRAAGGAGCPGVVAGDVVLTRRARGAGARRVRATATATATGGASTARKPERARRATWPRRVLVPAAPTTARSRCSSSTPTAAGVERERGDDHQPRDRSPTSCSTGAPAEPLGGERRSLDWLVARPGAARRCAPLQVGVCEEALRLAAEYTSQPRAVRPAAVDHPGRGPAGGRRLHRHRGDAGHAVAGGLAARPRASTRRTRWWWPSGGPSEGGQRVVHATQHLHGGMGADVDYPVHRYFLWGKQIERHPRRRRARSWPGSGDRLAEAHR